MPLETSNKYRTNVMTDVTRVFAGDFHRNGLCKWQKQPNLQLTVFEVVSAASNSRPERVARSAGSF
jgi:hypothetical protein